MNTHVAGQLEIDTLWMAGVYEKVFQREFTQSDLQKMNTLIEGYGKESIKDALVYLTVHPPKGAKPGRRDNPWGLVFWLVKHQKK